MRNIAVEASKADFPTVVIIKEHLQTQQRRKKVGKSFTPELTFFFFKLRQKFT